jgi:hypothetical protein
MSAGPPPLRQTLLALQQRDLAVRSELEAEGVLFEGYHPRMEAVHRENAERLRGLIAEVGWPNEELAGSDGAEAAWLIAQHAIGEPDFMRECRSLVEQQAAAGRVPRWQFAYLDDRVRVSEGKPQHFGTQIELTPDGPVLCEVEDIEVTERLRRGLGLAPTGERLRGMVAESRPTREEYAARKEHEAAWRRRVGWAICALPRR